MSLSSWNTFQVEVFIEFDLFSHPHFAIVAEKISFLRDYNDLKVAKSIARKLIINLLKG